MQRWPYIFGAVHILIIIVSAVSKNDEVMILVLPLWLGAFLYRFGVWVYPIAQKISTLAYAYALNFGAQQSIRPPRTAFEKILLVLYFLLVGVLRLLGVLKYVLPSIYYQPDYEKAVTYIETLFKRKGIKLRWIEIHMGQPFFRCLALRQKGKRKQEYVKLLDYFIAKNKLSGDTYLQFKRDTLEMLVPYQWIEDKFTPQ